MRACDRDVQVTGAAAAYAPVTCTTDARVMQLSYGIPSTCYGPEYTRNIHGVLLAPLPPGSGEVRLDWPKFAISTIGYSVTGPGVKTILSTGRTPSSSCSSGYREPDQ